MPLCALTARNAKPRDRDYKLHDGRGLYLLVTAKGQRYWRFKYRFEGKERTLAFGVYPDIELADARARRDAARKLIATGVDPAKHRHSELRRVHAAFGTSFDDIADEWLNRLEMQGRAQSTQEKNRWLVDFARPALGRRDIRSLTAPDLLAVLRKVEARGRHETANRLRSTLGSIFRYAIATGRAERDVPADLRGALIPPKVSHRAAITEERHVGPLLRAIEGYEGDPGVRHALRLSAHLFVRPGELRLAERTEFDPDLAIWIIPAARTKMRRPHKVPLSRQVMAILAELEPLSGDGRLLFPSNRSAARAISDNTLNAALRRMGFAKDEMTAHGFRALASTLLNECGRWHPDAIERQLGHLESNDVRRAYARGEHWTERVQMMQFWSDWLDRLRLAEAVGPGRFAGAVRRRFSGGALTSEPIAASPADLPRLASPHMGRG